MSFRPPEGMAVYWKYNGKREKNSGVIAHIPGDSDSVRMARFPGDELGVSVRLNQIEWIVKPRI
jgi:hypothetical protein